MELAFLSVSLCQLLFRSSTQETCAPTERALADTTQQPASGRGDLKQERTTERHQEKAEREKERERRGHAEGDKTGERHAGNQSGRKGVKRWQQLLLIKNQKRGRERAGRRRRGFHSWQGKREKAERARSEKKRGDRVCGGKRRGQQREEEGRGRESADRGKRFRQGGEIRGFAGAAWTTNDLNGALNPAVAYPDFPSISPPTNTFECATELHEAPSFPQRVQSECSGRQREGGREGGRRGEKRK